MLGWLRTNYPEVDEQTFVLWEPCSKSHGEVIPGYAKYLLDLGYKVLVLMTPERIPEGLFSHFSHSDLTLAKLSQKKIRKFMQTDAVHKAAGILITTAGKLPKHSDQTTDLTSVFAGSPPNNVFLVEHDAAGQIEANSWQSNLITLRDLSSIGVTSVVANPHYFGDLKTTSKSKAKTCFTMVGAARSKRRNDNLVLDAAQRLVAEGYDNFEIRLVGKKGAITIPDDLRTVVTEVGRVDFSQLYEEISVSDFVLTAFQGTNEDHSFYRTTGTTGSFQLAYGFGKPCIVQKDFAVGTALHEKNSLFYDTDDEMYHAMKDAIDMSDQKYTDMQNAMVESAKGLYAQSISNLRELFHG